MNRTAAQPPQPPYPPAPPQAPMHHSPATAPSGPPPRPRTSRISSAAEALGYGGGAVTCLAALYLLGSVWSTLGAVAQTVMLAVATLVLSAVAAIIGDEDGIASRLSTTLWLMAGGTGTFTTYLAVEQVAGLSVDAGLLSAGLAAASTAGVFWRRNGGTLVGALAYLGATVSAFGAVGVLGGGEDVRALALWVLGATWSAAAAWDLLHPAAATARATTTRRLHHSLGALTAVSAAQAVVVSDATPGLVLGLITVAVLLATAVRIADALAVCWAVGAGLIFVPQAAARWVPDDIAGAAGLMTIGVTMLIASGWLVWRARR